MPPEAGNDPADWLAAAREHLEVVGLAQLSPRVRCFHGQRAVELAFKALLIFRNVEVPKTHSIERLVLSTPDEVPYEVSEAAQLTTYAVQEMYPDTYTDLDDTHASEAFALANIVIDWVAAITAPTQQ